MKDLGKRKKNLTLRDERPLNKVVGSYTYFADNDVLLAKITPCFENGKLGIARNLTNGVGFGSSEYIVFRSKGDIDPEYLFHFLSQDSFRDNGARVMTGAVGHKRVPKDFIENYPISMPPLFEQKRIVAIIDESFERIEKAVANAEKNLTNAGDLFESHLNNIFIQKGNGWVEKNLSEICEGKITDGTHQTPKYFDEGYVFLSSKNVTSGLIDWENVKYLDENQHIDMQKRLSPRMNDILLAKNGTTGVAAIVDKDIIFDIYVSLALLRPSKEIHPRFLWHFINSPVAKKQFNKRLKGIGVPNLHLNEIREVTIFFPEKMDEQDTAVTYLDNLLQHKKNLESIYQKKIAALAELKQTILQKAFAGELTANNVVAFLPVNSKQNYVDTTAPDFSAHILAFAYHWHKSQKREKTFGRVKAQKILHLTESIAKVDLGRAPIKDAAGPNDFRHMLKAEDWARSQQYFEFSPKKSGNGYDFKKLPNYSKVISDAFAVVKPYQVQLEKILALILPMNTQQAEVFATVHAAWNNLLIDRAEITDEKIIKEARENWHPDKVSIPIERFSEAIKKVRSNCLVPEGKAKRVMGQEGLF